MPVVTISRQFGSGGRDVGSKLAHILNAEYIDKEILIEAARRTGASEEILEKRDERLSTFGETLSRVLEAFLESSAATGAAGEPLMGTTGLELLMASRYEESPESIAERSLNDKRYQELISSVILDIAKSGNVVILGRGSQVILRDLPNSFHIYLVASLSERIRRTIEREEINRTAAKKLVEDTDRKRIEYLKRMFKINRDDPLLYDLIVNTTRLPLELVAEHIAELALKVELQGKPLKIE